MWKCLDCGCLGIAASLDFCPMCFKERDMATCTTGGASNANALPGETGYVPDEVPEVPEVADAAGATEDVPVADAAVPAEPAADDAVPEAAKPAEAVSEPKPAPKPAPKEM